VALHCLEEGRAQGYGGRMTIQLLPVEQIHIGTRQRSLPPHDHILSLTRDIRDNGLIHAISVDQNNELVAGFCRLNAVKLLNEVYSYGRDQIPAGYIPVIMLGHTDERVLFRVELMENLQRRDLTPLDRAKAVSALHRMFQQEKGEAWTNADTGAELDKLQSDPRTKGEIRDPKVASRDVADSMMIESFANDPDVQRASTRAEAIKIVRKKLQQELTASLGELSADDSVDHEIFHGKCEDWMPKMEDAFFNGIVCDPPYGVDADTFGAQTMVGGHQYEDTQESAINRALIIMAEGFRLCKPDAHLYMFCDIRYWPDLAEMCKPLGWSPFATPLIWHKPGLGHAPQPGYFGRRYECILFAQKGNRKLSKSHSDVFEFPAVKEKIHAAQKPVELIRELLSLSFFPGESVLDPVCGSGTVFRAAHDLKLRATGIELDEKYYNICKQVIGELK